MRKVKDNAERRLSTNCFGLVIRTMDYFFYSGVQIRGKSS